MTLIRVPGFGGLNLALAPQRLQDHEATVAINCDFRNGDLRGIAGDTAYDGPTPPVAAHVGAMFFKDRTNLVESGEYADFVRSPAFYANGTVDQRVFYATETSGVRILVGNTTAPTTNKLLGVPKPGDLPDPSYLEISGKLTEVTFFTDSDAFLIFDKSVWGVLKVGAKIIISAPGFTSNAYTIRSLEYLGDAKNPQPGDTVRAVIRSTTKKWSLCQATSADKNATAVTFKAANDHKLFDGDQVVLSLGANADTGRLPTNYNQTLWDVTVVDATKFTLTQVGTGTPFQCTAGAVALDKPMRFAKVADQANQLPSATVNPTSANGKELSIRYTYAEDEATWENSAYSDTAAMRAYLITYVNDAGDESEPSNPTDPFLLADGMPVTFASFPQVTGSAYLPIVGIRIYRTDASGQWRFIPPTEPTADQRYTVLYTAVGAKWTDTTSDSKLAEVLTTTGWAVPPYDAAKPEQNLRGIISAANGVVVGYTEKTVCPSVAYSPYAFPIAQQVSVDYKIMGLVATASGVCVLTEANPYVLVGSDPSGWGMVKLETNQACVAHKSIVDMGGMGIYASPDGLVGINGADVKLLTQGLLTREQWQARYNPTTITAAWAEDKYIATYDGTGGKKGFIYDPQTNSIVDLDLTAAAMANNFFEDKLLIWDGTYKWFAQDQSKPRAYTWASKWFTLNAPNIFGWGQIGAPVLDLKNFQITIEVWAFDGAGMIPLATYSNAPIVLAAKAAKTWLLANVKPFRLPVPDDRYTAYQLQVKGTLPLSSINLANVMDELKQVGI